MSKRLRSIADGAFVGLTSGAITGSLAGLLDDKLILSLLAFSVMGVVGGALVGWLYRDVFRQHSWLGGMLVGVISKCLLVAISLPFIASVTYMGAKPIGLDLAAILGWALTWAIFGASLGTFCLEGICKLAPHTPLLRHIYTP